MKKTDENLIIETWFPTTIGIAECPFINEIKNEYLDIIIKFKYDLNGFCSHYLHKDERFFKLNNWIIEKVNEYAFFHKYKFKYEIKNSWLLDYPVGSGQELHAHPGSTISAVFYLEAREDDSPILFKNPLPVDAKNPHNLGPHDYNKENKDNFNDLTYPSCLYPPLSGRLIIFRSYLFHSVESKKTKDKRIAFSYSFDPI
jgi:uncharacterized protein (TIGR02466 family)